MRLLDLYCGAGGAAAGYDYAGFDVVGVDILPQPHFPFEFVQGDAVEYLLKHGHEFDAIHASPPCQAFSAMTMFKSTKKHPNLIPKTRAALIKIGKPYVIENVVGAPLLNPIMLCGTMFGLNTARHRLFETSFPLIAPEHPTHKGKKLYTALTHSCRPSGDMFARSNHKICIEVMGIDWMNQHELGLSIPPAYTFWIGERIAI